jgi:hypothetical protein
VYHCVLFCVFTVDLMSFNCIFCGKIEGEEKFGAVEEFSLLLSSFESNLAMPARIHKKSNRER